MQPFLITTKRESDKGSGRHTSDNAQDYVANLHLGPIWNLLAVDIDNWMDSLTIRLGHFDIKSKVHLLLNNVHVLDKIGSQLCLKNPSVEVSFKHQVGRGVFSHDVL